MAMGYRSALDWLLQNDDCDTVSPEYLAEEDNPLSVVAAFVADCYGKTDTQLKKALIARQKQAALKEA